MKTASQFTGDTVSSYTLWLSSIDTYNWAHKPGAAWPCSDLSGKTIVVEVDRNGLRGLRVNGDDSYDAPGDELEAMVADHLKAHLRHLWPTWEQA